MTMLVERFLRSTWHFRQYLKLTGVYLDWPDSTKSYKKWITIILWSAFWLIFNLQSAFYSILERGYVSLVKIFRITGTESSQMDALMNIVMALSPLLFSCLSQIDLIFTAQPSVTHFLNSLESVDIQLQRPSFLPNIRRYSIAAVVWIVSKTLVLFACALYWRVQDCEFVNWQQATESLITILCGLFTLSAAWTYIICCQLLNFYYNQITNRMNDGEKAHRINQITETMSGFQQLQRATDVLHRRFSTTLMINCGHAIFTLLSSSYFLIRPNRKNPSKIVLDLIHISETLSRLILVCYSTDSVRSSGVNLVKVARKLRDEDLKMSYSNRKKVTLFIVESFKSTQGVSCIFGILPLSRSLILRSTEFVLTFLLIIYQFKLMEKAG